MSDCKCKVVYKASDGKEFSTMEECRVYENRPKVYAIEAAYRSVDYMTIEESRYILDNQVYVDENIARKRLELLNKAEEQRRIANRGSRSKYAYELITLETDIRAIPSIQDRLTNEAPEPSRSWVKNAWSNLWKYRG